MSMVLQLNPIDRTDAAAFLEGDEDALFAWIEAPDTVSFDLDKAWHAVHAVLSGSAWETGPGAASAVLGGQEFGDDLGYGPARYLPPELVAEIAEALAALGREEFVSRIDPDALAAMDVYPGIWDEPIDEITEYVGSAYETLYAAYASAAAAGQAMIVTLL